MPIYQNNYSGPTDTGGSMVQVLDSTPIDNIFTFSGPSGSVWQRIIEGKTFKASYFVNGTSDATTKCNTVLASSLIKVLIIDIPVTLSGTLTIPVGKKIKFDQGGYLTGTAILNGSGLFDSSLWQFCFDTNITVSAILPYKNKVSPQMWGAQANGSTDDGINCGKVFRYIETLSSKFPEVIFPAAIYMINTAINLPYIAGTKNTFLKIKGYGAELKTTSDIAIFNRLAINQIDVGSLFGSYEAEIEGFSFTGTSVVGGSNTQQSAMRIGVTYNWSFRNLAINSMRDGIDSQFALKCLFSDIMFTNCSNTGMMGRNGQWTGATTSNAAFNANVITRCRFFNPSGSFTSIYLYATNMNIVRDCVSEGSNPQYNFYLDYGNSSVVNTNTFENLWIESTGGTNTTNTIFYLNAKGNVLLKNIMRFYPNRIFEVSNTCNGLTLVVDTIPYMQNPPVSPLTWFGMGSLSNGAHTVTFNNNLSLSTIFQTPSSWDTGALPARIQVNGPDGVYSGKTFYNVSALQYQLTAPFLQLADDTYAIGVNRWDYVGQSVTYGRAKAILAGTYGVAVAPTGKYRFEDASGASDVNFTRPIANVGRIEATGAIDIARGTTAQRPAHYSGRFRMNIDTNLPEISNGTTWLTLSTTSSPLNLPITPKNANFTLDTTMRTVLVDSSGGNITITVTPSNLGTQEYVIKKISSDANVVSLQLTAGLIDNNATQTIAVQNEKMRFQSDLTNLWNT